MWRKRVSSVNTRKFFAMLQPNQFLRQRYQIHSLLGQGGFGAVYRALDLNLNRWCAVKENLDASLAAQQQFQREAMLLSR